MKFNIYTLGCKVNIYESNVIADQLKNHGYQEVSIQEPADISIINTCSVTNMADHKSMKTIKRAIKENPNALIIACGCFAQKEKKLEIDGVDIVIGNQGKSKILDYIEQFQLQKKKIDAVAPMDHVIFESMKLNNSNKTRAFVKIQDGCNNFCTYCIIPYTRGNVRSKKREDVLDEVTELVQHGHKEIVLTGIHTGNYGAEFENYDFANLLNDLIQIKGLKRIRISSIEMTELNDRVLNVLKKSNILVDHLHIPLQSGSDTVLKRMNRKYTIADFIQKIEQIRKIRPNISITTDVITGFPGETEEEFKETISTIQQIKFAKLHVFPYSKREGTAACLLPNHIDNRIKKERARKLIALSKKLEMDYMNHFIGQTVEVLPETIDDEGIIGHTGNYLLVKVKTKNKNLNQERNVTIESVAYPYCIGYEQVDEFVKI